MKYEIIRGQTGLNFLSCASNKSNQRNVHVVSEKKVLESHQFLYRERELSPLCKPLMLVLQSWQMQADLYSLEMMWMINLKEYSSILILSYVPTETGLCIAQNSVNTFFFIQMKTSITITPSLLMPVPSCNTSH